MNRIGLVLFLLTTALIAQPVADRFSEQHGSANISADVPPARWWSLFGDPELTSLIDRAVKSNLDLKLAGERLLEARAARRVTRSALLPSVDATTSYQRIRGGFESGNVHVGDQPSGNVFVAPFETGIFDVGFDATWEIDLFGHRRHELRAATAELHAAGYAERSVLVSLTAEVARDYLDLRGLQRRLVIVKQNIQLQSDSLHLTESRAEAGIGTHLDVQRQKQQLATTEAQVPSLGGQIQVLAHALSVLMNQEPASLEEELNRVTPLPQDLASVPVGLPAQLLERRPDIQQAKAFITAAGEQVGAAKADLFPRISLTGAMGRQSTDLSTFTLGAGNFFSVGPSITLPIFEAGRLRAQIAVRKQQFEEAQTQYRAAVLHGLQEAEDSIALYGRDRERVQKLRSAVESAQDATGLASELYSKGLTDFLGVLDAQREQLASEDQLAESDTTALRDLVAIYKSLGGGWDQISPSR